MGEESRELEGRSPHRTADVETPLPAVHRHVRHRCFNACRGKVWDAENRTARAARSGVMPAGSGVMPAGSGVMPAGSGVKIVEVEILRDQLIGLVQPRTGRDSLVARLLDDRAKTGVLEEVPPERVAGTGERLVAGRDPRATFDEVVAAVERGYREVVVERMHLEALEGHDGGPRPLPDIADHVAEISLLVGVHRAARSEVF